MTTAHEPAYPEDGTPKERYAAYHAERAKAGDHPALQAAGIAADAGAKVEVMTPDRTFAPNS